MKIIVPIKQVPESSKVKMDSETGTVIRTGVETVVNPLDLYALETALRLREQYGGTVTALTMGPPQAKRVLKEAEAMGCDDAVLVSDRAFGGADTWATSYTLSQAIKKIGDFDLIITGERATDGDTAQVGPGIAAHLDLPVAAYVSKIREIRDGRIYPERLMEEGYEQLSLPLPCLITVVKEIGVPRLPTLKGKIRSRELEIPLFSTENMDLQKEYLGLNGSPTRVVKIDSPRITRGGRIMNAMEGGEESLQSAVDALMLLLEERGII
jgi:electron transfer flavoprotein beta subunit